MRVATLMISMITRRGRILSLIGVLAIAGCATPTSGPDVMPAGPSPTVAQAEAEIRNVLGRLLKDPDSVKQFEMDGMPRYVSWYRGLINGGGHESAWLWCFSYNAKNSFGAYVGVKRDGIAMRVEGDRAVAVPLGAIRTNDC
jgi:hypothetical protein